MQTWIRPLDGYKQNELKQDEMGEYPSQTRSEESRQCDSITPSRHIASLVPCFKTPPTTTTSGCQTHSSYFPAMSTTANSYYFRRRTIGRAASPPTWACYEQIPYDGDEDSDSGSDSCSEDDDEYSRTIAGQEPMSDSEEVDHPTAGDNPVDDVHDIDIDMDEEGNDVGADKKADSQKDVKGKQRATDPEPESKKQHRKRDRPPVYTLRPILTIQKSQGFVWNQVCVRLYFITRPL